MKNYKAPETSNVGLRLIIHAQKTRAKFFFFFFRFFFTMESIKGLSMCFGNMEEYKFCPKLELNMNYILCLVFSSKLGFQKTVLPSLIFHFFLQWVEKAAVLQATGLKKRNALQWTSCNTMQ